MGDEELVVQEQPFHQTNGNDAPWMDAPYRVWVSYAVVFSLTHRSNTDSSTM